MHRPETARYYDLFHDLHTADLAFYVALSVEEGGPVLVLGAGSGRVAVAVARAGVPVVGVESSAPMLARFAARLSAEPDGVQRRVVIVEGDMRSFRAEPSFRQVLLPSQALLRNLSAADRDRTLDSAWRLLAPGGRLALHASHPNHAAMRRYSGEAEGSWREVGVRVLDDGTRVVLSQSLRFDTLNKRIAARSRWTEGDRVTEEEQELGYVYRDELVLHLEKASFALEQLWGDFQRSPLEDEGQEMVVVARKVG